jgi:hypothetical protein
LRIGFLVVIRITPPSPSGNSSSTGKLNSSALSIISSHGCFLPRLESQFFAARSFSSTFPILAIVEKDCLACSLELASIQKTPQKLAL